MGRLGQTTILAIVLGTFPGAVSSQASFSHGLIQRSCAPWDGPAVDIRLAAEPVQCGQINGPYIDMGVWRGLPIHSGDVVKFGSGSNNGFASRCTKEGNCERAESGTIKFESFQEGSGATGYYELHFKKEIVSGTFDVKWCENRIMCG
jgi:hypothetical protein